jgi:hypothetical protein
MNLRDFVLISALKLFLSHQGISARGIRDAEQELMAVCQTHGRDLPFLSFNACHLVLLISKVCFEYQIYPSTQLAVASAIVIGCLIPLCPRTFLSPAMLYSPTG